MRKGLFLHKSFPCLLSRQIQMELCLAYQSIPQALRDDHNVHMELSSFPSTMHKAQVGLADRKQLRRTIRTERCQKYRHPLEVFEL